MNLPNGLYDSIEAHLKSLNAKQILFVPNMGNAGDCLINSATYQFLDKIGVDYVELDFREIDKYDFKDKHVVLGGGGGFIENYNHVANWVKLIHPQASTLTLLPMTVRGNKALLESLPASTTLFIREQESFDYLNSLDMKCAYSLSHDMALVMDYSQLKKPQLISLGPKRLVRSVQAQMALSKMKKKFGTDELVAYRVDSESTGVVIPENNIDLSDVLTLGSYQRDINDYVTAQFLGTIERYAKVSSNRLHVCIGALLMGKPTKMLDNNYGKLSSIYQHSLKQYFDVEFVK